MFHPENPNNTLFGVLCGFLGGIAKFLIDIPHDSFTIRFGEAVFTALACGIAGGVGNYIVKKVLKSKK